MKIKIILCCSLLFTLSNCGGDNKGKEKEDKPPKTEEKTEIVAEMFFAERSNNRSNTVQDEVEKGTVVIPKSGGTLTIQYKLYKVKQKYYTEDGKVNGKEVKKGSKTDDAPTKEQCTKGEEKDFTAKFKNINTTYLKDAGDGSSTEVKDEQPTGPVLFITLKHNTSSGTTPIKTEVELLHKPTGAKCIVPVTCTTAS